MRRVIMSTSGLIVSVLIDANWPNNKKRHPLNGTARLAFILLVVRLICAAVDTIQILPPKD